MHIFFFGLIYVNLSPYGLGSTLPVESPEPEPRDLEIPNVETNTTGWLESDYKSDDLWKTVNDATIRIKATYRSARPIYIRSTLILDQRSDLIEIVFDALPKTLYMKRNLRYASDWEGPMFLPSGYQNPPNLQYFLWSEVHLGGRQILHLLYGTDCFVQAKAAYNKWEIYEEPGRPMQVWYYLSEGVGVRYETMRINAFTSQIIKGRQIEPSGVIAAS